jgi:hypothetical protein
MFLYLRAITSDSFMQKFKSQGHLLNKTTSKPVGKDGIRGLSFLAQKIRTCPHFMNTKLDV